MVHFASIWNNVKWGADLWLSKISGRDVILKRLFRVVYYIILWKSHTIYNESQSGSIVYSLK